MSDTDTLAWKAVVGGLNVSGARETIVDNFIVSMKSANLWARQDRVWLFAGDNQPSAMVDFKARDTISFVATPATPTFAANRGYTALNSSGYVDTTYNFANDSVNFTAEQGHIATWNMTDGATLNPTIGVSTGATGTAIYPKYIDGNAYIRINDYSPESGGIASFADCRGMILGNRNGPINRQAYFNGVDLPGYGATGTVGLANATLIVWDRECAFLSIGGPMNSSEQFTFYNIVRTYMIAVGAVSGGAGTAYSIRSDLSASAFASLRAGGKINMSAALNSSGALNGRFTFRHPTLASFSGGGTLAGRFSSRYPTQAAFSGAGTVQPFSGVRHIMRSRPAFSAGGGLSVRWVKGDDLALPTLSAGGSISLTPPIYILRPPVKGAFVDCHLAGEGKLKLDIELFNSDFIWPRINEKAGSQVLWAQATGMEKAFADTDAYRLTRIYAELIRDQWDPVRISYRNLPYLAWAIGVNLWEDWWSEEFKRFWVAEQWTRKYERGSYLGLKNFTSAVGGYLKRAITPPAKTFPTHSLTVDERKAYLMRFPQLRMYPYYARSQRPYNCMLGGHSFSKFGTVHRSRNGGYVQSALRKMYPTAQTTGGRYQRIANIYDPLTGGMTQLTVRKIEKVVTGTDAGWGFTPGVSAYDEEVVLPIKERVFFYIGESRYLGAAGKRGIFTGKKAALRTITISRSGKLPFVQGQIAFRTISPSQQLMQLMPEKVGEKHTTQMYRLFSRSQNSQSSRGCYIHHCYPMRSEAWRFMYDRWYLFDADRVPDQLKGGQAYLGRTRLGIDHYTAEALIRIRTKYLGFNAHCGGFVGHKTFLHKLNPEAILRLRRGVTASMALRDTVLINTKVTRKIQVRDIINPDGSHQVGELVES